MPPPEGADDHCNQAEDALESENKEDLNVSLLFNARKLGPSSSRVLHYTSVVTSKGNDAYDPVSLP